MKDLLFFAPNLGIFVFYTEESMALRIQDGLDVLKMALDVAGQRAIAQRLTFEYTKA